jgi:hypothetical protein
MKDLSWVPGDLCRVAKHLAHEMEDLDHDR